MPTLATLPLDIVRIIVDFLDSDPERELDEEPSISRARREVGRRIALIAPNFTRAGTELVWRTIVINFHKNRSVIQRIIEKGYMAPYIRNLVLYVSVRKEDRALRLGLADLLPLLGRLKVLTLQVRPEFVARLLERAEHETALADVDYLKLDTTETASNEGPGLLLHALPYFSSASRCVSTSLRVRASSMIEDPAFAPVLRTRKVVLAIHFGDVSKPTATRAYVSAHLALFTPELVTELHIRCLHLHFALLDPFLSAARNLRTLKLYTSRTDLSALLDGVISAMSCLNRLSALHLGVEDYLVDAVPFVWGRSDPTRMALGDALARPDSAVEEVQLDAGCRARVRARGMARRP